MESRDVTTQEVQQSRYDKRDHSLMTSWIFDLFPDTPFQGIINTKGSLLFIVFTNILAFSDTTLPKWSFILILNDSTCQFYYKVNTCVKPYKKNGRGVTLISLNNLPIQYLLHAICHYFPDTFCVSLKFYSFHSGLYPGLLLVKVFLLIKLFALCPIWNRYF